VDAFLGEGGLMMMYGGKGEMMKGRDDNAKDYGRGNALGKVLQINYNCSFNMNTSI
jgi:hypothetical protein